MLKIATDITCQIYNTVVDFTIYATSCYSTCNLPENQGNCSGPEPTEPPRVLVSGTRKIGAP